MSHRILAAALLALAPAAALAAPSPYVPGEVLVKFRDEAAPSLRAAALAARAHAAVGDLDGGWTHVRLRGGQSVDDALAGYAVDPAVEWAQPNYVYRAALAPNDPSYGQQWALRNYGQTVTSYVQPPGGLYVNAGGGGNPGIAGSDIEAEKAWGKVTDCSGAVVAVLDTGVNYNHQDLAANMWNGSASCVVNGGVTTCPNHGWDFVTSGAGDNNPMDLNGHGTHVAGTIGAVGNNGVGGSGVCWGARIMAVRVLDQFGSGTSASIIAGMNFASANGAKIVNMSLGGGGSYDPAYANAIQNAMNAGVLVVVAAGNEANNNDGGAADNARYPCNFTHPNVLCVAALDQNYELATFSNYGTTSVDVGAPGTNILATWPGTNTAVIELFNGANWSGTTTTYGTGGGWGVSGRSTSQGTLPYLSVPYDYWTTSNLYNANTHDRAWRSVPYNTAGATVVTVEDFEAVIDLAAGDWIRIGCRTTVADPFGGGGVILASDNSGIRTYPQTLQNPLDLTACASATSTLGFQLQSQPTSARNYGIAIAPYTVKTLALDTTSYNTISGTSMATPVVAGVAAMLRAYNPSFTYADTVAAIVGGGRAVGALSGKTRTGRAVSAMGALANVQAPTGLTFTVLN